LLRVVAGAMAPFGRWNTVEDTCLVGIDGAPVCHLIASGLM